MKSPFITRARHEAEMAAKDAEIERLDLVSGLYRSLAENRLMSLHEREQTLANISARLRPFDASNRRRDERGRYVGEKK